MQKQPIFTVKNISKSFKKAEQQELLVLDNVNFELYEGEIVALLGKSGSGKSTLLRIIAGLSEPSSGTVTYRDQPVQGPVFGMTMVFQNFALLPWLTVLENVELGLEALGIPRDERRTRALKAIDIIGLDGFESAFPKELSGGMRQRVGFARALVVNPDILLMDEPFSALDVLTAENLKSDLLDLWETKQTGTRGILFVTHNIEEAVLLANRIIVFDSDPGTIRAELKIDLLYPRSDQDPAFRKLVDQIYSLITRQMDERKKLLHKEQLPRITDIGYRLPDADISELSGLLETLDEAGHEGHISLPELSESSHLNIDDLFPLTEVLDILGFAYVNNGELILTDAGKLFANADILERKKIFAAHLLRYVPLAKHIRQVLEERITAGQRASKDRFLNELEDFLSEKEAERVLRTVIDWGRYAELFAYSNNTRMLSLENPN
ncbi:ABC transporter ATP binding protein [Candidatus Rickettsiella viridis]|uniref:ABC transporter ATP binding protein n=1 Tax=Candidatus Rickettsiella viridis TaxID=676208 RepID=A0A2Z5UWN3_9COXI|nr:nitrate/sulfonate/bicarbonate ABC transporter ATP-binding protein [Candidatus Rickettsiella viridis]BBB15864.1 ABC transporter ATP binding protein [Candidatus Rickettsiella viridis]